MQVSINRAPAMGAPAWEVIEGSPQSVADHLGQGVEIGPVWDVRDKKFKFKWAGWLFVALNHPAHLVASILAHPFTQQHAGAAWLPDQPGGEISCLIGFPLPAMVADADRYRLLLSGLATIYGAKAPSRSANGWRVAGGSASVLSGALDEKAVERLEILGLENRSHWASKADQSDKISYVRSMLRLDRDVTVKCQDGSEAPLASLAEGTMVYCPLHIDTVGVATVIGSGAAKAVQCPFCQRNFWNVPKQRGVDFGHFRKVFDTLHAQEEAVEFDPEYSPAELKGKQRQFELLREQYLPSLKLQPGFTLVRSPKGSGKTEALKDLVEVVSDNYPVR